jgi:hypothetical protein
MSPTNLYFIDFDGTLFRTEVFWADFTTAFCKAHNITPKVFIETYAQSKSAKTVYDIDQHISLLKCSRQTFDATLTLVLEKKSYAFPEVEAFLKNHTDDTVVILTQGIEWFQKAKIASVPGLNTYRTIVTDYKKRLYIEQSIGFFEDGVLWEGNHYKSLTFVDNMADAFLTEDHGPVLRQYRILRKPDEDSNALTATQKHSTEITSLLDM